MMAIVEIYSGIHSLSEITCYAGCVWAQGAEVLPRSWAYRRAADPEFAQLQMPSLQLRTADPVAYLERHEAALGHNTRNVMHIAAEVGWL